MIAPRGVLLLAYGSPATLDDVDAYYTHIRGGRTPAADLVDALRERYRRIGGRSPLVEITRRQALAVQRDLDEVGLRVRTYVGMKHAPPFIAEVIAAMARDGVRSVVGMALAPQYSSMSVGTYIAVASEAARRHRIDLRCIEHWHDHPGFIRALASRVGEARRRFDDQRVPVIFTAHSLPQRILTEADPYPDQVHETCQLVAAAAGVSRWAFAYQSAGKTAEPWLGPDLREVVQRLHRDGVRDVIVCPVGFVADHLEVLYDIDIEGRDLARALGMRLERAPSLNDGPDFIAALADLIRASVSQLFEEPDVMSRMER